jgi:lysozyme
MLHPHFTPDITLGHLVQALVIVMTVGGGVVGGYVSLRSDIDMQRAESRVALAGHEARLSAARTSVRRAAQRRAAIPGRDARRARTPDAGNRSAAHRTGAERGSQMALTPETTEMAQPATTICPLPLLVCDAVIDVSHHNGAIDWPAVAACGIALAFIKATQGGRFVDPAYQRNRAAAASAGILAVPYHFLDGADPDAQAEHFLAVTGLSAGETAMIDWESAASAAALVAFGAMLADAAGRDPLAYYGFAQLPEADPTLARWPLMLPGYPRGDTPGDYRALVTRPPRLPPGRTSSWDQGRPYDFHQYTPAGRVPGIATAVDRSVWVGSAADLRAWFATGTLPAAGLLSAL